MLKQIDEPISAIYIASKRNLDYLAKLQMFLKTGLLSITKDNLKSIIYIYVYMLKHLYDKFKQHLRIGTQQIVNGYVISAYPDSYL